MCSLMAVVWGFKAFWWKCILRLYGGDALLYGGGKHEFEALRQPPFICPCPMLCMAEC